MATYTHEYQSTKKFYFDLDSSYVLRQAAPYIVESQDKVGVVVNVLMKLWLRVSSGANITRSNMKFILFKYNSSLLPSNWTARSNKCYRYANDSTPFTYNEEKFRPYLLATSETFTKTWKGEVAFDVNFTPTDLGKKIEEWNGTICLAVSDYGSGSGSSSKTTHCYWPWVSNKHGSYYILQYAQESPLINLNSSSFKLGTTSTVNIAPYSTTYKHKVTWQLGDSSFTSAFISAGKTTASYTIPTNWRKNFGVAENTKDGKVIIDTYDTSGNKIGSSKEYSVTYTIDDYNYNSSIIITNDSIVRTKRTGRFTNQIFNNYLISGYDTFYVPFSVNFSSYNSKSKNISVKYNTITKTKNIEAFSITSANTESLLHTANNTSVLMQVKVTDLRGKTGVLNCGYNTGNDGTYKDICNYTYLVYNKPQAGTISFYRGREDGSRDDLGGLYGVVNFSDYKASYSSPTSLTNITNSINLTLKNSQGNKIGVASTTIASGSSGKAITLVFKTPDSNSTNSKLSLDEEYTISGTITDLSGYSQNISGKISSSNYLLHFRYQDSDGKLIKQKSIGIGQAGRDLNSYNINNTSYKNSGLLSIAYPIELTRATSSLKCFTSPIRVVDGGTGAYSLEEAQKNLEILPTKGGTMTGDLKISRSSSNSGGIYLKDSTGALPGALYYNGTNLWIGSTSAATTHHNGGTYISTGYNGTSGNDSIYISIPNATNNGAYSYKAYHAGNIFYSASNADGTPDSIPGGTAIAGMIWLKPIS